MKVLRDNYTKEEENLVTVKAVPYPRKIVCDMCESELEYEESDLRMGALGCMYVDCPLCGESNMLEENEHNIALTKDNIEYPTHFFHTCKENGAVVIDDDEVEGAIRRGINDMRRGGDIYYHLQTGDLNLFIVKYERDEIYEVIISRDFYSTDIPFEEIDY